MSMTGSIRRPRRARRGCAGSGLPPRRYQVRPGASTWIVGLVVALAAGLAGCPTEAIEPQSLLIDDLSIEPIDVQPLACRVHWTTTEPADGRVEFTEPDGPTRYVEAAGLDREHELVVFGLHAETEVSLVVSSTTADGRRAVSAPHAWATAALPFPLPAFELTVLDEARVEPGWTAINVVDGGLMSPPTVVLLDMDARPVWVHRLSEVETFADLQVSAVEGPALLIGGSLPPGERPRVVDMAGRVIWEGPAQPDAAFEAGWMHHTFQPLADGGVLTLTYDPVDGVLVDTIVELDADGAARWRWHAGDHLDEALALHVHGNMARVDEERGVAYYHAQQLGTLYQIDRDDGALRWALGEGGDFAMLGDHHDPWFRYAHAPEPLGEGRWLFYDNGDADERGASRVIEYAIDEDARTAEVVWEYPGEIADDDWFTFIWGDADRLANGNTLIDAGSVLPGDSRSRVFEVTGDGELVWEVWIGGDEDADRAGSYMVERIPTPVGVIEG